MVADPGVKGGGGQVSWGSWSPDAMAARCAPSNRSAHAIVESEEMPGNAVSARARRIGSYRAG